MPATVATIHNGILPSENILKLSPLAVNIEIVFLITGLVKEVTRE